MVEEHGVHGFAEVVVASERKAEVADATADVCAGQMFLDPRRGTDEVKRIAVMLGHTCGDGQDIGVEDDVFRGEGDLFREQAVSALTDSDAALIAGGLPLLIEGHHDDGSAHASQLAGMSQECLLALFQRDAVDDGLSLDAAQGGADDLPARGVNHEGHAADVGFRCQQVQEVAHLGARVQQAVVEVDVQHEGAVLHLLAGYLHGFLVALFLDESQELTRTGYIAALAHVDESHLRREREGFQSGE